MVVRAKALASTRICTTGACTAFKSREMIYAGMLGIAVSYAIGVRAKMMGSERKRSCSGANVTVLGAAQVKKSETRKQLSKSSRDLATSPISMFFRTSSSRRKKS